MRNYPQPGVVIKAAPDQDLYIGWSTICEMPSMLGTRAELLAYGVPAERLNRADANGTSSIPLLDGAWGDKYMIAEQRGLLPREHLAEYCALWLDGRQDKAFDLLVPFEDETEEPTP